MTDSVTLSRTDTDTDTEVEADTEEEEEVDLQAAKAAGTHSEKYRLLYDAGIRDPSLSKLAAAAYVTPQLIRDWVGYIAGWDVADTVRQASLVARLEARRQVPPEHRRTDA